MRLAGLLSLAVSLALAAGAAAFAQEAARPPGAPSATRVDAITINSEAGLLTGEDFLFRTRVNVDMDGYVKPAVDFLTEGGRRIVIDLPGVVNKSKRRTIEMNDTCVKQVRIGEHKSPEKVRVVLDLQENVGYDVIDVSFTPLTPAGLEWRGRLTITLTQQSL